MQVAVRTASQHDRQSHWPVILLAAAALAGLATPSAATAQIRTVALAGQPAPGTPSGVNYGSFLAPVLNAAGQTAFTAGINGDDIPPENSIGIWSEGSGSLALVARGGSPAPGTSPDVNFDLDVVNGLLLSDAGQTAFYAKLTGVGVTTANERGIWAERSGSLALVARAGSQAPDTAFDVNFDFFNLPALNAAGKTAFLAELTGGVTFENGRGIWSEGFGILNLVARAGDPAPGTLPGVSFIFLNEPVLNAPGETAFLASLTGSGVDVTNIQGIWSEGSGTLALVARAGNPAPGTSSGVNFSELDDPVINHVGETAFRATLTGNGVDGTNGEGIWSEGFGSLALVARAGDPAPDAGANFMFFADPVLNAAGRTAFFAELTGSGVTADNDIGLWMQTPGTLHPLELVAREGSQAPGTPIGVTYSELFFEPVLNAAGQAAFVARLTGDDVTFENNFGIWATDLTGVTQLIARTGDELEIAPGEFRTVSDLAFVSDSGNGDGRRSGFNDLGQLAFRASFTDGSTGIFVSNRVASAPTFLAADFDEDGDVDGNDYLAWRRGFAEPGATHMRGNADNDADADGADFLTWQRQFGAVSATPAAQPVPEPTAWLAALLGSAALAFRRHVRPRRP